MSFVELYTHYPAARRRIDVRDHRLDLSGRHIIWYDTIENLDQVEGLDTLDLSYNELPSLDLPHIPIKNCKNLESLRTLDLSFNKIRSPTGLESLPNLEYLDLAHNERRSSRSAGWRYGEISKR
ncbi:MAG: leucine-rich repeat domain-containing protein [Promethearchaeota archaeon]